MKRTDTYYKILTEKGVNEATILLYGFIGEEWGYDDVTERWKMTGVTDIQFVKELSQLAAEYPVIHIRINSPGGDFLHGNAIMTAILACTAEVHTWNDGIAASLAADIWLCGKVRHMAKNALMMIHPAWSFCMGNAQDMRDSSERLDRITDAAIIATSASVGMTEDDMRAKYYAESKDHWLSYNDAVADGLVSTEAYEAAELPEAVDGMSYKQLLHHFQKKDNPEGLGFMAQVKAAYTATIKAIAGQKQIHHQSNPVMDLNEFKKSLEDGSLDRAAVEEVLKALAPPAPPAEVTEPEEPAAMKALREELGGMKTNMLNMQKLLEEYGAKPGDSKSAPAVPEEDHKTDTATTTASKALEESNKQIAAAAAAGQNIHVGAPRG